MLKRVMKLFLIVLIFLILPIRTGASSPQPNFDYKKIVNSIDYERILSDIRYFSSLGSRVTGYPGSYMAAEHIINTFSKYCDEVQIQNYSVAVPIDNGASLTLSSKGKVIPLSILWPNLVQTSSIPPEGLEGRIIYVGSGELSEFDGKDVEGSIVLMEFNSIDNWINAAKLGANAVIFIAPADGSSGLRQEAEKKFVTIPLYFPRLYMERKYLPDVMNESRGLLKSNMEYKNVEAKNILGIVRGTKYPNDIIAVVAHYDCWSVVPKNAPGADESSGIAVLLEFARFLKENPPKRTVWLLAVSGYWQALAGAREFVEKFIFSKDVLNGSKKVWLTFGLDFSTDSYTFGMQWHGDFYNYWPSGRIGKWIYPKAKEYLIEMEQQLGRTIIGRILDDTQPPGGTYGIGRTYIPIPYMTDTEPFSISGIPSLTFRTTRTFRSNWGCPFDLYVNLENLKPQVDVSLSIMYSFINEDNWGLTWEDVRPLRSRTSEQILEGAGFMTLSGIVWQYNVSSGFYSPVPNALVHVTLPGIQPWFRRYIVFADRDGKYEIHGIPNCGIWSYTTLGGVGVNIQAEAYVVNFTTGIIEYAPDQGLYGAQSISPTAIPLDHPTQITPISFRCGTIAIFDVLDVRSVRRFLISGGAISISIPVSISIYDISTYSSPDFFSVILSQNDRLAVIFAQRGRKIAIKIESPEAGYVPLGLLINSSAECPEGYGYMVTDKQQSISMTALRFATDFNSLAWFRYKSLLNRNFHSLVVERDLEQGTSSLQMAEKYFKQRMYEKLYAEAMYAWSSNRIAYLTSMSLTSDASNAIIAFFLLLIPFSLVFERLFLRGGGKKRFIYIAFTFTLFLGILYYLHPGFSIAQSASMMLLGLVIEVLSIIVLGIVLIQISGALKVFRRRVVGGHFAEISKLSAISLSFSVGIENMRRRPIRTFLILSTFLIIMSSVVSLASISHFTMLKQYSMSGRTPYNGLLIKRGLGEPSNWLSPELVCIVKGLNATVSPRMWYYPPIYVSEKGPSAIIRSNGNKTYEVSAFIGLSYLEPEVSKIDENMLAGRWFIRGEKFACILTEPASRALNVTVGSEVYWDGYQLTVVGIADEKMLNEFIDLDQAMITPLDPVWVPEFNVVRGAASAQYIPLSWERVLIVPYDLTLLLGGTTSTIAVKFEGDSETLFKIGGKLSEYFMVDVYTGYEGRIMVFSRVSQYGMSGASMILIPLIIAAFIMLNSLLDAIYERLRDIKVYSLVGLSPLHITAMFFIEVAVYAVIAGELGYIIGIALFHIMQFLGALPPEMYPNYCSVSVLSSIGLCMSVVMLATLYPAFKVSRLVTPSLTRKWKIPTAPTEDLWDISLPILVTSIEEGRGLLLYLYEYFMTHTTHTGKTFIVRTINFSPKEDILTMNIQLAPFDAGITQDTTIRVLQRPDNKLGLHLTLKLITGMRSAWIAGNHKFIDEIRKQGLMWRSIPLKERRMYIEKAMASKKEI
jgi:hypothetical protein